MTNRHEISENRRDDDTLSTMTVRDKYDLIYNLALCREALNVIAASSSGSTLTGVKGLAMLTLLNLK